MTGFTHCGGRSLGCGKEAIAIWSAALPRCVQFNFSPSALLGEKCGKPSSLRRYWEKNCKEGILSKVSTVVSLITAGYDGLGAIIIPET
jgi:hypothetical protein